MVSCEAPKLRSRDTPGPGKAGSRAGSLSSSSAQGKRPKPRPVRHALMRFPVRVHRPMPASTRSMAAWDPHAARGRAVDAVCLGDQL